MCHLTNKKSLNYKLEQLRITSTDMLYYGLLHNYGFHLEWSSQHLLWLGNKRNQFCYTTQSSCYTLSSIKLHKTSLLIMCNINQTPQSAKLHFYTRKGDFFGHNQSVVHYFPVNCKIPVNLTIHKAQVVKVPTLILSGRLNAFKMFSSLKCRR